MVSHLVDQHLRLINSLAACDFVGVTWLSICLRVDLDVGLTCEWCPCSFSTLLAVRHHVDLLAIVLPGVRFERVERFNLSLRHVEGDAEDLVINVASGEQGRR